MRYYRIEVTNDQGQPIVFPSLNGSGMPPGVITSVLPDGTTNPAALNIELDLCVYGASFGDVTSYVRIWGLSLAELGSAFNLSNKNIKIFGGMAKGYPLANPQQAGLLGQGQIGQAFGNWIGTDMTLDMYVRAHAPEESNFTFTWAKGEPLSAMIQRTMKVVAPNQKLQINISANRVANADKPGVVATFTQFAQVVSNLTNGEVMISSNGQTVFVFETATAQKNGAKQIAFQDLLGQVTWVQPQVVQAKLVMRGDLSIGDTVQFPEGLISTTSQNAMPGYGGTSSQNPANKLTFSGKFTIMQVQHWGNSRQPDAQSWNTTINCVNLTDDTSTPSTPPGSVTIDSIQISASGGATGGGLG
jgi:hypothetical protein